MGRRVFVGSVVAALPLVASTRVRVAAQSGTAAHTHADGVIVDPVLEHIARQLATHHNAMRRDPRGEHLRAFAAQLRTLTVYGRQIHLDDVVRARVNALVAQEGRYAVLYTDGDVNHLRSELRAYGAQPDERLLRAPITLDYAARNAVLDAVLQSGVSAGWERIATTLERLAPEADRRAATIVRVSRQYDAAYWEGYCKELWNQYSEAQFLAAPLCASAALPIVGIAFTPLCIAQQLAATFLALVYGVYCMNVL